MVLTGRVMVACLALIVSASAVAIWYDFPSARFVLGACRRDEGDGLGSAERLAPAFDVPRMGSLTRLSLPLALSNSVNLAYYHVARLVIVRHHGEADLGIYAASAQIALAGHLVTTAFALATGPRMARFYVDRNWEAFTSVLLKFLAVSTVIGASTLLVGVFVGSTILRVLYTADYARQPAVFLWLLGAAALSFVATCFGTSLTVSRQFGMQLAVGIVSVATALLVSLWLVPRMGLVGGGIAAAATSVVRLIGLGTVFLVAYSRARNADAPAGMPAEEAMAEAREDPA
jgi:O-antigen/teichoic acid export membrane protein